MSKIIDYFKTFFIKYKSLFILVGVVIVYCLFLTVTGIGCPIKYLTGVSCAGCGMSRAYMALLRGDWAEAFRCHPLFILPPIVVILIYNKKAIKPVIYKSSLTLVIIAFIAVYLYRLIGGNDEIVVFDPQNGLILRVIQLFRHIPA